MKVYCIDRVLGIGHRVLLGFLCHGNLLICSCAGYDLEKLLLQPSDFKKFSILDRSYTVSVYLQHVVNHDVKITPVRTLFGFTKFSK